MTRKTFDELKNKILFLRIDDYFEKRDVLRESEYKQFKRIANIQAEREMRI
jgi:hypothetical protein